MTLLFAIIVVACNDQEKQTSTETTQPKQEVKKDGVGPKGTEIRALNLGGVRTRTLDDPFAFRS